MSKTILPVLAAVAALFVLLTSMGAAEASSPRLWRDGTYVGKAQSHGGEMEVTVVVKDGRIQQVVPKATDTEGISDAALTKLPAAIVKAQSTEVDAVTGASETSEALKTAVTEALKTARVAPTQP